MERTGNSPGCNHLDVWLETVEGQLETDLIIALARASMGDKAG